MTSQIEQLPKDYTKCQTCGAWGLKPYQNQPTYWGGGETIGHYELYCYCKKCNSECLIEFTPTYSHN